MIPGTAFGPSGEGHVRACYATSYEQLEEALEPDRPVRGAPPRRRSRDRRMIEPSHPGGPGGSADGGPRRKRAVGGPASGASRRS